jgi:hypothetical protein
MVRRRRAIEPDFLCHLAMRSDQPEEYAGVQFHLLRAAAATGAGGSHEGERYQDLTERHDAPMPIRTMAVHAWSRAGGFKPSFAVDGVLEHADLQLRRAYTLALAGLQGRRKVRALEKIAAAAPECRPTAAWVHQHGLAAVF